MSEPIEDTGTWGIWPFATGFMVGDGKDSPIAFAYEYEARKVKRLLNEYQSEVDALEAKAQAAEMLLAALVCAHINAEMVWSNTAWCPDCGSLASGGKTSRPAFITAAIAQAHAAGVTAHSEEVPG